MNGLTKIDDKTVMNRFLKQDVFTKEQIQQGRKKMSNKELQEHIKNMKCASNVHKSKKVYSRKEKHKKY